ncbi:MAG: ABC transporter ATP-binding protein [Thermoleophilaceae bacterium]|nr:ABC transporter ATP-binding protein [Thermoleophilaceae bacterium]
MSPESVIHTKALTKRFGSSRGIENVTLEIERGEIFGLLGPNGAGKSTTLRCLLGLLKPTSGTCSIFEHDAWHDRVEAHRHIGVLPSDYAYEKDLTGRQVLQLFARLRGNPVGAAADALAERLQADLDRPQKELSRGNQQKIGLIVALSHDPDVVIMDEPTAGLDPLMQEEFLRIVAELSERGRTVLLSSHNMAEVERACDRVAMIHQGKVLEIATVDSVLARSPKEVHAVFASAPSPERFAALDGVSDVRVDGNALELLVRGNVDAVVRAAAELEIVDFVCERPSLESAFVQLYENGAGVEA